MPGESQIISQIRARAARSGRVVVGIGDDAAVVEHDGATDLLACCDLMVEGVHFRSEWSSPSLIGRKALAVTLSDIAAMGGVARFAMASIALPPGTSPGFISDLIEGLFRLADAYGVSIIGGDTSSSPGPLFIDTSVIGECARGRAVTRRGASAGDRVFVTGALGGSSLGLSLLESGLRLEDISDDEPADLLSRARREALTKHLAPEPLLHAGRAIGESGIATSMIDISDGLSTDLLHILDESECGAVIHASQIPVAGCVHSLRGGDLRVDPLQMAIDSGEEYELVFTARPADRERLAEMSRSLGVRVTEIGEVVERKGLYLEIEGSFKAVEPSGYEHKV
jgi:thiamine-monophosphate kinase